MKSEKRDTDQKKELLYQLESIVKTIYPNKKTSNPYENYLKAYYQELNIEDVLLFKRLLKSVTLMNHKERVQEGKYFISSYGDILMTIELISQHTINDVVMRSYVQLKDVFKENPFTKLQAQRVLRKSTRSVERYIGIWIDLKLVKKSDILQGKKHMYELIGYLSTEYQNQENFKDFYEEDNY